MKAHGGEPTMRGERTLRGLVFGMTLLALVVTARQLWTTDFGFDEQLQAGRRIVTEVDRGGAAERAGIAHGDEILADPGLITLVAPWTEREIYTWNRRLGRALATGHVTMRIRHGTAERTVDVIPDAAPNLPAAWRQLRRLGPHIPTAFAFLAVAILLTRRSPSSRRDPTSDRARALVVASCAFLGPCWLMESPAPAWPLWLDVVSSLLDTVSSMLGVFALAAFSWTYPSRAGFVRSRWLWCTVAPIGVYCALHSTLNSLDFISPVVPALAGNALGVAFDAGLGLAVVLGLAWQRAKAPDLVIRRQATLLLVFSGVGMFVPIVFLLVPQYVFGWCSPTLMALLFPFPVLIPIGFASVIARYRLFSLDGFALRSGPYLIALATSLIVGVALALGVEAAFALHASAVPSRSLGIIVAIVATEPLRRWFQVVIDRTFARDRDAFLRQCSTLAATVARTSGVPAIEREVRQILDAKSVRILVLTELLEADAAATVCAALTTSGTIRVADLRSPELTDVVSRLGFELLVAVPSDTEDASSPGCCSLRVLALTLPVAPHLLGRPEQDALALVGRIIGATLAYEGARGDLERERLRAEDERRHIAMELHDGLGATLTAARLMTRRLRAPSTTTATATTPSGTLDALDATLSEGLGELRTSLWSLDTTESTWEGLGAKVRRQATDKCDAAAVTLTMSVEGAPLRRVSPGVRLGLVRIAQEATSNALKHGAPRTLDIVLCATDNAFQLTVDDDGTGLVLSREPLGRGLGNMRRRAEALGGAFRIERRSGGGTRVFVSVPARTSSPADTAIAVGTLGS